jgi:hypothetical protein
MERLKTRPTNRDRELSVMEQILLKDDDPRIAFATALDMLFGGIDSVGFIFCLRTQ